MSKEVTVITLPEAKMIRELIQLEIAAQQEGIEVGEDGYLGNSNREQKQADKMWETFFRLCELKTSESILK